MKYIGYFYVNGTTKEVELSSNTEKEAFAEAKNMAHIVDAEGVAVYKDGVLKGDWTLKSGKYYSNLRTKKKKDKQCHPFGL